MILKNAPLKEGYALADKLGVPVIDEKDRLKITGKVLSVMCDHKKAAQLASAGEAYYVFRKLHAGLDEDAPAATLLGDYFFSVFSCLIFPFQEMLLLDRFSDLLQTDFIDSVKKGKEIDLDEYLVFLETVCGLLIDNAGQRPKNNSFLWLKEWSFSEMNACEARDGEVRERVQKHLRLMEKLFLDFFSDDDAELQKYILSVLLTGGKRIRPTLAFLAACFGDVTTDEIVPLMAIIELIHSCSLVHDDVVDRAMTRRGRPTIYAEKGNHVAVQIGDYALSKSVGLFKQYIGTGIGEVLVETSLQMCIGELHQLREEYDFSVQSIDNYMERTKHKTAYLISNSCYTGAIIGKLPNQWKDALKHYGLSFGMAFQLCDDVLDYEGASIEGKPAYQDMNRGIFTLPLLYALDKKFDNEIFTLLNKREKSDNECKIIVEWVRNSGGIVHTKTLAADYADEALLALGCLPDCGAKELLADMVNKYR